MLQPFNASPLYHATTVSLYHMKVLNPYRIGRNTLFLSCYQEWSIIHRLNASRHRLLWYVHTHFLCGLFTPQSHEKEYCGKLYHNSIEPLKIAFKRVISLYTFYRTQNLFHIMSVASCRCAFYAVCSPHLQAIFYLLVYSYTNSINTLKKENTRVL